MVTDSLAYDIKILLRSYFNLSFIENVILTHREVVRVHIEELCWSLVSSGMADEVHCCEAGLSPAGHKHQHRLGGAVHLRRFQHDGHQGEGSRSSKGWLRWQS